MLYSIILRKTITHFVILKNPTTYSTTLNGCNSFCYIEKYYNSLYNLLIIDPQTTQQFGCLSLCKLLCDLQWPPKGATTIFVTIYLCYCSLCYLIQINIYRLLIFISHNLKMLQLILQISRILQLILQNLCLHCAYCPPLPSPDNILSTAHL